MNVKIKYHLIVFLTILCMVSLGLSAQYKSVFGRTQTSWNVSLSNFPVTLGGYSDSLFVSGDTVVNSYTYKKIHGQSYGNSKQRYLGSLREDTITGKLWFVPPYAQNSIEELIQDLSLINGDIFYFAKVGSNILVDSVYYINGIKHLMFDHYESYHPNDSLPFTMIEGVGPNYGVIYSDTTFLDGQTLLLCSRKDSIREFVNTFYNGVCAYAAIGLHEVSQEPRIKIYPNPAKGFITIECEDREGLEDVRLYNVNGVLARELSVLQRKIDVSDLPYGVYFLVFGFERENVSKRIVIE